MGKVIEKKIEILVENLEKGMSITCFLDVPQIFKKMDDVTISFLKRINFKKIKIRRFSKTLDILAKDLMPYDEVLEFYPLNPPLVINNQKTIDVFLQYGFKKITALVTETVSNTNGRSLTIVMEETKANLNRIKDNIDNSRKIIDKGYEVLSDMFEQKQISEKHITGAKELARDMVVNISKNSQASMVLSILKDHDEYTFRHCVDVANQVIIVCNFMGDKSEKHLQIISMGGLLHDIGKSMIPKEIINKPGPLSDDEWAIMKKHPTYSAEILSRQGVDDIAIDIAHFHHVKKNGKGYPQKAFSEISDLAKLTAISDVFQALVTKRPYKMTDPPNIALSKIRQWASDDFDERLVDLFIKSFGVYPIGSVVLLNDKRIAFVVGRGDETTRPLVAVVVDENRKFVRNSDFVDLSNPEFNELKIVKPLDHRKIFKEKAAELFMRLELH